MWQSLLLAPVLIAPVLIAPVLIATVPASADIGPLRFTCQDGTHFTLTFHDGGTATLGLPGVAEPLVQQAMASGITYAGPRHVYREHQGQSELATAGGATTQCRRDGE